MLVETSACIYCRSHELFSLRAYLNLKFEDICHSADVFFYSLFSVCPAVYLSISALWIMSAVIILSNRLYPATRSQPFLRSVFLSFAAVVLGAVWALRQLNFPRKFSLWAALCPGKKTQSHTWYKHNDRKTYNNFLRLGWWISSRPYVCVIPALLAPVFYQHSKAIWSWLLSASRNWVAEGNLFDLQKCARHSLATRIFSLGANVFLWMLLCYYSLQGQSHYW